MTPPPSHDAAAIADWQTMDTAPKDRSVDLWVSFPLHDDRPAAEFRSPNAVWDDIHEDWKLTTGFRLGQYEARPSALFWRDEPPAPSHSLRASLTQSKGKE